MEQEKIISAIFQAGWSQGKDIGDPAELGSLLNSIGLSGVTLIEQTRKNSVKELLKQETNRAIELGVFGVPTMIIDQQLFWGNDQFDHMALYIEGKDPIDEVKVAEVLGRKRAIDRKSIPL